MKIKSPFNVISWRSGDNFGICDRCGFKYYRSEMRTQWDNLIVCYGPGTTDCWEPRQPQDFVKAKRDQITVYDTRTEGEDQFITTPITPDDL